MHAARLAVLLLAAGFVVLAAGRPLALQQEPSSAAASSSTEKPRASRDLQVGDNAVWTDTDLDVQPGERAVFTASGTGRCPGQTSEFGPNGLPRGYRDLLRILPVNQAGRGALIGRIGDKDVAQPFLVGATLDIVSPGGGILTLGVNESSGNPCRVQYAVHIDIYPPQEGVKTIVARRVGSVTGVDEKLFGRIPRRIGDNQGNPGDMVNFLILGSDAAMQRVFTSAGWVRVDADVTGAVIAGVVGSLSKESYVTMPMSQLYLFGRPQDYGWAHAEPIRVVASRHHLRVWKAPFQVEGSTLWVGAATHDIGFERDRRNNGVTHKIDPDVDLKREYVEKTLTATGLVSEFAHVLPANPLRDAKTATGGTFHSDGEVLVLKVDDTAAAPATTPVSSFK